MPADVNVRIVYKGVFFDEPARDRLIQGMRQDMTREVAQQGLAEVHFEADRMIRNPTPYWETQLQIEGVPGRWPDMAVNDTDVIYGPWLEGTGSRNRTTRFKGYAIFRRMAAVVRRKAPGLVAHVARRWVGRLNA